MVWRIIYYVCGGFFGWLLYESDIRVDDWQFWALLLISAVSNFASAQNAVDRLRKIYQNALDDYHRRVMKLLNFNISEEE